MARCARYAVLDLLYLGLLIELFRTISAGVRIAGEVPESWPRWVIVAIGLVLFVLLSWTRSLLRNGDASPQAATEGSHGR